MMNEDSHQQTTVGDVVDVGCEDGITRQLMITEIGEPCFGGRMPQIFTEDGRQIGWFYEDGWCEAIAH